MLKKAFLLLTLVLSLISCKNKEAEPNEISQEEITFTQDGKLQIIKDKYFRTDNPEEKKVLSEDTQDDMEPNEENSSDDVMAEAPENIKTYANAISRTIIK